MRMISPTYAFFRAFNAGFACREQLPQSNSSNPYAAKGGARSDGWIRGWLAADDLSDAPQEAPVTHRKGRAFLSYSAA